MLSASLSNGILYVTAGTLADTIAVTTSGGGTNIVVTENGVQTGTFATTSVNAINISGSPQDDNISVTPVKR
jgi:hypothetical protein